MVKTLGPWQNVGQTFLSRGGGMRMNWLKGKTPVLEVLRPDLGARLMRWVADDMERARRERQDEKAGTPAEKPRKTWPF
jgi:hypothetical protein